MEYNFSMFRGVAIQMYEATLVSDNSRFDQYMEGNRGALTALEVRGMDRFNGKGECSHCHSGPEFTDAAVANVQSRGAVEQLPGGMWHDVGFHNIGVRPTTDDMGIAAGDPSGLPSLSVAQMASQGDVTGTRVPAGAAVSVRGAVKTPTLRNIEKSLTDERVRTQSAPFDHPSLVIPNGLVTTGGNVSEQTIRIPATGATGGNPLPGFCESLAGGPTPACN